MDNSKDISKTMIKIEDEVTWQSVLDESENKLVIINCHAGWCGPCDAILPTIQRVLLDYDEIDERFLYAAGNLGKVGALIQETIPAENNVNIENLGCMPLFSVYKGKTCISTVVGVDSPTLLSLIGTHMPASPVKE